MQKLSIKKIIEFKKKSDKSKKNFANALKIEKSKNESEGGGGDYWISSISAISNSYRDNNLEFIVDKKNELEEKLNEVEFRKTKMMYQRNIDILHNFEDFNLKKWRPAKKIKFLKKIKDHSILEIKELQLQVTPTHIFTYQKKDIEEIGAIWFIAKLNGYNKSELGMFVDILHRYLKINYSKDYIISTKNCIAVDVFNNIEISYSQLENGEISYLLNTTLDEIKKLM